MGTSYLYCKQSNYIIPLKNERKLFKIRLALSYHCLKDEGIALNCGGFSLISDSEAAYAAGILDGEGSISVTRNHSGRWPSPQVSVASTDRELMDWLRIRFGGSISTKQPRQVQHSLSYDWKLTDRRALLFLQIVRPYLVIERKIRRCDLLLQAYLDCTPRNGRYTDEMEQKKQAFLEQFSSLS